MLTPLAGTARERSPTPPKQRSAEEIAKGLGHRAGADERDGFEAAEPRTFDRRRALAGTHT
jgi:hypothetical protein